MLQIPPPPNYAILSTLGHGSYGTIYEVQHIQTKQIRAAKCIPLLQNQLISIQNQLNLLTISKHPNIVSCFGAELEKSTIWIIMEYCNGGSLADQMKNKHQTCTEQEVREIMRQMLSALDYLHKRDIVHRDVKAANILVIQGETNVYKLADFGIAESIKTEGTHSGHSKAGSPFWMAPELLLKSIISTKMDIWALGITAIELTDGQPPYSHQHPYRAIFSIQNHPPEGVAQPDNHSEQFNDFVRECLVVDHSVRKSASQLLSHPFINERKTSFPLGDSPHGSQDTIIEHEDIPHSIWEASEAKRDRKNTAEREDTVEELYRQMEEKVREVRREYIMRIRKIHQLKGQKGRKFDMVQFP